MSDFLANNRLELIARCTEKVAKRPHRSATAQQLKNGVPMFLTQLIRTLEAENAGDDADGLKISGSSSGDGLALSEIGFSAGVHGKKLLALGYTVDQVVHDYGDLCQAISDLAFERDAPFSVDEFRTLNRCLDNATANAVTEFSFERDAVMAQQQSSDANQHIGFLMHELRNALNAGGLAVSAMEAGNLPMAGATGAVLKRSQTTMAKLIDTSLAEVRMYGRSPGPRAVFSLAVLIAEVSEAAQLDAKSRECTLTVTDVDPLLGLEADREALSGAVANLLSNAFKFTQPCTEVTLSAYALGNRILITVKDNCGGLHPGDEQKMFAPFTQRSDDKTGLGLGLSIARQSVTADGGTLNVTDLPGTGCTFTINMPRYTVA